MVSCVLQQPLDALDDAQGRILEMVARVELKLGWDAALGQQVG